MPAREHCYRVSVDWNGNLGSGTSDYRAYARDHAIGAEGKPDIPGSAQASFRGDDARWNPEELLVAALSAYHQLWYLHLAADAKIIVTGYADSAEGIVEERPDGSGRFTRVVLRPTVTVQAGTNAARAAALHHAAHDLHHAAHEKCFIANSVHFPVVCEPQIVVASSNVRCMMSL